MRERERKTDTRKQVKKDRQTVKEKKKTERERKKMVREIMQRKIKMERIGNRQYRQIEK